MSAGSYFRAISCFVDDDYRCDDLNTLIPIGSGFVVSLRREYAVGVEMSSLRRVWEIGISVLARLSGVSTTVSNTVPNCAKSYGGTLF